MKKQKLIEKINKIAIKTPFPKSKIVDHLEVIKLIEQLDEPQKAKVPQFVADWIRKCKTFKHFTVSLSFALQPRVWEENRLSNECINWLLDANNQEAFARAWLDGYEVEEEKRYFVKIRATKHYISKDGTGKIFFSLAYKESFTKKQLEEAGFGWVFDCPGVEVEEVE